MSRLGLGVRNRIEIENKLEKKTQVMLTKATFRKKSIFQKMIDSEAIRSAVEEHKVTVEKISLTVKLAENSRAKTL